MAIQTPPTVTPAIGFYNPADGSDLNASFDPSNLRLVQALTELNNSVGASRATLFSAVRAAISQLASNIIEGQQLQLEVNTLEDQRADRQDELDNILRPALNNAQAELDDAQAALDEELAKEEPDPDVVAQLTAERDAAQAVVDEAQAAVLAAENEIAQLTAQIDDKNSQIEQLTSQAGDLRREIGKLASSIRRNDQDESVNNLIRNDLVEAATSQAPKSDERRLDLREAQLTQEQLRLEEEILEKTINNLVRETLATRSLDDLEPVRINETRFTAFLIEAGLVSDDPLALRGQETPVELFTPLANAARVLVVQNEINRLQELETLLAQQASRLEAIIPPAISQTSAGRDDLQVQQEQPLPVDDALVPRPLTFNLDKNAIRESLPEDLSQLRPREALAQLGDIKARLGRVQELISRKQSGLAALETQLDQPFGPVDQPFATQRNETVRFAENEPAFETARIADRQTNENEPVATDDRRDQRLEPTAQVPSPLPPQEALPARDEALPVENETDPAGENDYADKANSRSEQPPLAAALNTPPPQEGRTNFNNDTPVNPSRVRLQL